MARHTTAGPEATFRGRRILVHVPIRRAHVMAHRRSQPCGYARPRFGTSRAPRPAKSDRLRDRLTGLRGRLRPSAKAGAYTMMSSPRLLQLRSACAAIPLSLKEATQARRRRARHHDGDGLFECVKAERACAVVSILLVEYLKCCARLLTLACAALGRGLELPNGFGEQCAVHWAAPDRIGFSRQRAAGPTLPPWHLSIQYQACFNLPLSRAKLWVVSQLAAGLQDVASVTGPGGPL